VTEPAMPDPAFWAGKRVLLTGHTGFKGGWAALWLAAMGAEVTGLALAPDTSPALFALAGVEGDARSILADLREPAAASQAVATCDPQIVLHMAAQPLVRRSLAQPAETFATNVMGTVHLLEALRGREALQAILVVTSDKVYANNEAGQAFVEGDRLGGKDPYSGSKAAAELAVQSYARCYFEARSVPVATARGGNVIGGGDFSEDRLIPDIVRAVASGQPLVLRHPEATRPWQHVLDCLSGYFLFVEALAKGLKGTSTLNFGPDPAAPVTVGTVADAMVEALAHPVRREHRPVAGSMEMTALTVDASRARALLGWQDRLTGASAIAWTAAWYRAQSQGADMRTFTLGQIAAYRTPATEAS